MRSLILMKPRSVSCTPASLSPMSSTLGARPAATSTFSASSCVLVAAHVDRHRHGVLAHLHVGDLGAGEDVDAALLERPGHLGAGFVVLERAGCGAALRRCVTLRAEGVEHVGELAAHRAGADDDHRLRRLVEHQHLVGREHRGLVELEADLRQAAHAGAGGDHDGFRRRVLLLLAVGGLDGHGVLAGQPAGALDLGDLVLLEQELDALGVLVAHARDRFMATP